MNSQVSPLGELATDWAEVLAPHEELIAQLLTEAYSPGQHTLPKRDNVLRAFKTPLKDVRVVIVGQDPYPTPGDAVGLSFSVAPGSKIPRSLGNIYKELHSDLGIEPAPHGDLSHWADQGVLLLNRVLTVPAGDAGGHRRRGWETVTHTAIEAIAAREKPLVAILWGADAIKLEPLLNSHHVITSAHPSPLSARRGFFNSRPFSRANEFLTRTGQDPIDWKLPDPNNTPPQPKPNLLF